MRNFRHKRDPDNIHAVLTNLYVDEDTYQDFVWLTDYAYFNGTSLSGIVRAVLPQLHEALDQAHQAGVPFDEMDFEVLIRRHVDDG